MSPEPDQPEWISVTVADAVHLTEHDGWQPIQIKVGQVRMPHGAGVRAAAQAEGQELFVLPPATAARIIGALSRGLRGDL